MPHTTQPNGARFTCNHFKSLSGIATPSRKGTLTQRHPHKGAKAHQQFNSIHPRSLSTSSTSYNTTERRTVYLSFQKLVWRSHTLTQTKELRCINNSKRPCQLTHASYKLQIKCSPYNGLDSKLLCCFTTAACEIIDPLSLAQVARPGQVKGRS